VYKVNEISNTSQHGGPGIPHLAPNVRNHVKRRLCIAWLLHWLYACFACIWPDGVLSYLMTLDFLASMCIQCTSHYQ